MIYTGNLCEEDQRLIDEALAESHPCLTYGVKSDTIQPVQVSPDGQKEGTMPINDFGTEFKTSSSQFVSLKSKGDQLRFRLLGAPYVEGKHFSQNEDDTWEVTGCPRINDKSECETCNKYFEIVMKAKKTGDQKLIEQANKEARKYKVGISFYFPVIDRNEGKFVIFNSRKIVKDAIDAELAMGTKILERDWIVLRTEIPGKYYTIKVVDSSDNPPFTDEEKEEVAKFKKMDLSTMIAGSKEDDSAIAAEANVEVEEEK
jgi:hypothetical protein